MTGEESSAEESSAGQREIVDVSVVIPYYGAGGALQRCLASVLRQRFDGSFEVLVCASADTQEQLPALPDDPRLRGITCVPRMGAAAARNRAAAESMGKAIAFTDADVEVAGDWLERLAAASGGVRCVGGAVVNGTPHSVIGTAEYLLQFVDLHPQRPAPKVHFGATCNLYMPLWLWASAGPFPEHLDGGEDTILTAQLRKQGLFTFESAAVVTHLNRTGFSDFVRHQYGFGKFSSRLARLGPGHAGTRFRQRVQRHPALTPIAAVGKLAWVLYRVVHCDRTMARSALLCFPMLIVGVAAWSAGLFVEGIRCTLANRRTRSAGKGIPH